MGVTRCAPRCHQHKNNFLLPSNPEYPRSEARLRKAKVRRSCMPELAVELLRNQTFHRNSRCTRPSPPPRRLSVDVQSFVVDVRTFVVDVRTHAADTRPLVVDVRTFVVDVRCGPAQPTCGPSQWTCRHS